jgi:diacylglycerol kinase family enzyme
VFVPRTDGSWFVVNPNASGVRSGVVAETIRRQLAGREATISGAPPEEGGPRLVVAVGGDGTVNRVINQCDPRQLLLGIIPRGSANDLGAELEIPSDFGAAWRVLEDGCFADIDLVSVNGARFATCGGLGLATAVAACANRWKARSGWAGRIARRLGPMVYLAAALVETVRSGRRPIEATIHTEGAIRSVRLSTLLVSNQPRFGRWFSASPLASNGDGLLHLCGVRAPRSRAQLLWICTQIVLGRPERCPEIFQLRARAVTLETDADATFFGDGEGIARGRRFRIEVLPGVLRVATGRGRPSKAEVH